MQVFDFSQSFIIISVFGQCVGLIAQLYIAVANNEFFFKVQQKLKKIYIYFIQIYIFLLKQQQFELRQKFQVFVWEVFIRIFNQFQIQNFVIIVLRICIFCNFEFVNMCVFARCFIPNIKVLEFMVKYRFFTYITNLCKFLIFLKVSLQFRFWDNVLYVLHVLATLGICIPVSWYILVYIYTSIYVGILHIPTYAVYICSIYVYTAAYTTTTCSIYLFFVTAKVFS
eukprot:TRINITY_DN4858_c0_g1_i15.p1 TRINITY_DN4858_c0_g1~~TRINITY_DN4858_c0_g1_i15.p1  ORF type:complete len:226 (-),score=-22.46 TRINITY_DN4858_c0_g1_i15:315-992(-)